MCEHVKYVTRARKLRGSSENFRLKVVKVEITTYRELEIRDGFLPLFQHAFWWPYNPKEFDKTIKADPRLQYSPVGYVATKRNRLVGFVGVMDIDTRTLEGSEEKVGGIWGVVTHPAFAREGISTALMQKSHEYFGEKGYKFSLLNTSKSLIAHAFYQKLGYREALTYPSAYKVMEKTKKTPRKKSSQKTKPRWSELLTKFSLVTRDRTGFVVRNSQYGKMLEIRKTIQPKKTIVTEKGYALLKEDEGNVFVKEIMAFTKEEKSILITQIEEKAAKTVIAEAILDSDLRTAYLSQEFMILENSYDVLMFKPLAKVSFAETYGNKFYAAATDYF